MKKRRIVDSLDHKNALVTISFRGLGLLCLNERGECEVGLVECEGHDLTFDIQKLTFDPQSGERIGAEFIKPAFDLTDDLALSVSKPPQPGVGLYQPQAAFDRFNSATDPRDFRWTPDLEGADFGNEPLSFNTGNFVIAPRAIYRKITITAGTLYTKQLTDELFARVSLKDNSASLLGRVALLIGLDIQGSEVRIGNVGKINSSNAGINKFSSAPYTQYQITIDNHCQTPRNLAGGSDFRFFYDVVNTPGGYAFDLQRVVENGGNGTPADTLPGHSNFSLDAYPLLCGFAFLSSSRGLSGSLVAAR